VGEFEIEFAARHAAATAVLVAQFFIGFCGFLGLREWAAASVAATLLYVLLYIFCSLYGYHPALERLSPIFFHEAECLRFYENISVIERALAVFLTGFFATHFFLLAGIGAKALWRRISALAQKWA